MENKEVSKIERKVFLPVRWNTFLKDFFVIQIGFALFGLSIVLIIQANLGAAPWSVLSVPLADIIGTSIGRIVVYISFVVLAIDLLMKEPVGWGTLGNIIFIGPWLDVWMRLIPFLENNFLLQLIVLLSGVILMGVASAIYIGVDAGAGPRDSLMIGFSRISGMSLRVVRAIIELSVLAVGWLLGGPVGIGTAIFAVLIGPSVQWAFKIFNVKANKDK